MNARPIVLIVDDELFNVDYLEQELEDLNCRTIAAYNGHEALEKIKTTAPDVILLDIMMPEMGGFEVLQRLKATPAWRHIPVIIVSALDDFDSIVKGIELGADEYLPKPFDPIFLKARLRASLERKRWRDQERAYLQTIQVEREHSERLLLNILPAPIAERLKSGESVIADEFSDVTVLFADIVGFTPLASQMLPKDLVRLLNQIFTIFDELANTYGLEKIKTIGDAYMVVGGLPTVREEHTQAVANFALDIQKSLVDFNQKHQTALELRIGINVGPVIAGVIGKSKFNYDLWGDTVNTASRMESHGIAGKIQVPPEVYTRLENRYTLEQRGTIAVKGKGPMQTYFLIAKKAPA